MAWRLTLLLVLLAVPGVIAMSWLALPSLIGDKALEVPLRTLQVASAVQGAMLVAVAAVVGALLAPKVGLQAPALSALVGGGDAIGALRPQLAPGVAGGLVGVAIILGFHALAPEPLALLQAKVSMPLTARLLYGGITEEVLVRWGLMTLLAWAGWRLFQGGAGALADGSAWLAIGLSAVIFGAAHLPTVAAALGTVPLPIGAYVVAGNALFGVVAGYLFWRHGLEAAIAAHVLAHLGAIAIRG